MLYFVAQERLKPIPVPEKPNIKLRDALAALDRGSYRESLRLLDELEKHDLLTDEDGGGPDLIRGILLAQDAERMWDRDQIRMARQASRYLIAAKQKGIPWDYQGPRFTGSAPRMSKVATRPPHVRNLSKPSSTTKNSAAPRNCIAWACSPGLPNQNPTYKRHSITTHSIWSMKNWRSLRAKKGCSCGRGFYFAWGRGKNAARSSASYGAIPRRHSKAAARCRTPNHQRSRRNRTQRNGTRLVQRRDSHPE